MLHVGCYLTNIIGQTVLPLHKKPEEMISFGFQLSSVRNLSNNTEFRLTNEIDNMLDLLTHRHLILDH